jgi:hypothetical protein
MRQGVDRDGHDVAPPPPKRRLLLGAGVFVLGWVVTLILASRVTASSLPSSVVAVIVFVGPKLGVLAAVAILGKAGFAYLKGLVGGYLKPPAEVSHSRHRVGMVMFVAALLLGFLEPYVGVHLPVFAPDKLRYSLGIDILLLVSIFVLGGNFWDKIRALFVREATVSFPPGA